MSDANRLSGKSPTDDGRGRSPTATVRGSPSLGQPPQLSNGSCSGRRVSGLYMQSQNRFYPPATMREMGRIAERLAEKAADNMFSAADFRDATDIGRNVSIKCWNISTVADLHNDRRRPENTPARGEVFRD